MYCIISYSHQNLVYNESNQTKAANACKYSLTCAHSLTAAALHWQFDKHCATVCQGLFSHPVILLLSFAYHFNYLYIINAYLKYENRKILKKKKTKKETLQENPLKLYTINLRFQAQVIKYTYFMYRIQYKTILQECCTNK